MTTDRPSDLGVYLWNEKVLSTFYESGGIFMYIGDGENAKDGYRVNLGCVEGLARSLSKSASSTARRYR